MIFTHFSYSIKEIGISEVEIFQLLKLEENIGGDHISGIVRRILNECAEINIPARGGYSLYDKQDMDVRKGILTIDNTKIHAGSQICGYLKEADQFAIFICTAGDYITELTHKYSETGDLLEAYITDLLGSLIVEKAMDLMQQEMETTFAKTGLKLSQRYSPGYCNWALVSQKEIFSAIPANNCGISLTDSSLMIPIKSISGIIGIGKLISKKAYGCEICNNQSCIYREVRMKTNMSPLS